jgi:hypothetical protein
LAAAVRDPANLPDGMSPGLDADAWNDCDVFTWMDGVIKDPNLAPNHSFRHYLKSQLLDRDVPERISDAITGHKTPGIGRKYEHVEMKKKFKAISKLPVIPLAAA